jgi:hypothetical protein
MELRILAEDDCSIDQAAMAQVDWRGGPGCTWCCLPGKQQRDLADRVAGGKYEA